MARLRIITANLQNGGADDAGLQRLLAERQVDVACLQELSRSQASAVLEVLPFGKLEPGADPGDHDGMGIALRRPAEVRRLPLGRRDARVAELRPSDWPQLHTPLELLNVHIRAPHLWPWWRTLGERRQQLAGLLQYLEATPRERRLWLGDFNASPIWPLYRRLAERLADIAAGHAEVSGQAAGRTWGPTADAPRLLRIDHAFGRGLAAASVEVLPIPGSDHDALLIEIDGDVP
jgi:endonuclease/exonuclease/phosphatase family metal-dependent hydrolase